MGQKTGKWNSLKNQQEYEAAYSEALQKMPKAEAMQIATSFGMVQVYRWKNDTANHNPPILLLPGKASGTPMWSENLPGLYKHRTIYSVDALGDAGLSVQTKAIENSADQARWIEEVFLKLELDKVHVMGHSFGGWLASNFASIYPERIASLILIEPVFTFQAIKPIILLKSIPYNMKFLPKKWRQGLLKEISGEKTIDTSDPVAKMIHDGANYYKSQLPQPKMIAKTQLQSWSFPVYVAFADNSGVHNSRKAVDVARYNVKNINVKLWENATHSLPMEYPTWLDNEIIKFIETSRSSDKPKK